MLPGALLMCGARCGAVLMVAGQRPAAREAAKCPRPLQLQHPHCQGHVRVLPHGLGLRFTDCRGHQESLDVRQLHSITSPAQLSPFTGGAVLGAEPGFLSWAESGFALVLFVTQTAGIYQAKLPDTQ